MSPGGDRRPRRPKRLRKKKRELSAIAAVIDELLDGSTSREDAERVYVQPTAAITLG